MPQPSPQIDAQIRRRVMADLVPSVFAVHWRVGTAAIGGAALSLIVCGQFGLGLTGFATNFSELIHHNMPEWLCALTCGALFAIAPTLVLRLVCRPMLFNVLVRSHRATIAGWFAAIGLLLLLRGDHGQSVQEFVLWVLAAVAVFQVFARLVLQLTRQEVHLKTLPI